MVKKRGDVYYLRLFVPLDLQGTMGRKEIVRTLRTEGGREAKRRAAAVNAVTPNLWRQVRALKQRLRPDDIITWVKAWLDDELSRYDDPLSIPLWLSNHPAGHFEFLLDDLQDQRMRLGAVIKAPSFGFQVTEEEEAEGLTCDGPEFSHCRELADQLLLQHGVKDVDDESKLLMVRGVAAGLLKMTNRQIEVAIELHQSPGKVAEAIFKKVTPSAPAHLDPPALPVTRTVKSAPLLSEVIAERLRELQQKVAGKTRASSTAAAYEAEMPFLLKILGDRPVDEYVRADFIRAQSILQRWPIKARKMILKNAPDTPIEEIIGRKDLGKPMAPQTVHRLLLHITSTFSFAEEADHIMKSKVPAWQAPVLSDDEEKPLFTEEQLTKLFAMPNYAPSSNCKQKKPARYWMPILALLTGARINELCQLYANDFVNLGGIPCISINTAEDKGLKTKSSKRVIPIHPRLIELGFLDHVEAMRAAGEERLWPELTREKKTGGYSNALGKYFSLEISAHVTANVENVAPTFHSLRKNFVSALSVAEVPDSKIGILIGHAAADKVMNAHYKKMSPEQRAASSKPIIDLLHFPALDHLR